VNPFRPSNYTVLVIDDETDLVDLVIHNLAAEGYRVLSARTGEHGIQIARREKPSLVILDLLLPDLPGMEVCRSLRAEASTAHIPILMLTARTTEIDRVSGFESGADDYVTKPFGVRELTARIAALTRRVQRAQGDSTPPAPRPIDAHDVVLDPAKHVVRVRNADVCLTPHEFELLYQLASNPGVVLTRKELLALVWRGQAFVTERSIDTLVRHLRCKIEPDPTSPQVILTVWGYGYKFSDT